MAKVNTSRNYYGCRYHDDVFCVEMPYIHSTGDVKTKILRTKRQQNYTVEPVIYTSECNHNGYCTLRFIGSHKYDAKSKLIADTVDKKILEQYEFNMEWLQNVTRLTPDGCLAEE